MVRSHKRRGQGEPKEDRGWEGYRKQERKEQEAEVLSRQEERTKFGHLFNKMHNLCARLV